VNDCTITLPEYAAHHQFTGGFRALGFPTLRLLRGRGIDAVLEAQVAELTEEDRERWARMKAKEPKWAFLFPSEHSWVTLKKEIFHEEQAFNEHPLFKNYLHLHGSAYYRHPPCYVALNIYADGEKLKKEFGDLGIEVLGLEEYTLRTNKSKAMRNALLSGNAAALATSLAEQLSSQKAFTESVSAGMDVQEFSKQIASAIVMTSDTEKDETKN